MMIPMDTLKIGSTHQDKNDKMDIVGLYSCEKSYVSVTSFLMPFSMMLI